MAAEKVGWGAYHDGYPCARLDTTVAGACSVILKVFFDEGALMSNCVQHAAADGLTLEPCPSDFVPTVGNEINKLVSNVAMGRGWAGIHYRSDSAGIRLGEDFDGFAFTRYDGTTVRISRGGFLS